MKTAVLIPCYNEEATIAKVILDFRRELPYADIYVFDNNSTDNTYDIAENLGAIVVREPRQGKGNVVRSMFSLINADIYVLVDGDDTYPAEAVTSLITPVANHNADMVVGDRLSSTYFKENKRLMHNSGNRLVRGLINTLFRSDIKDVLSGYRAFSREFVKNFPVLSDGFEIETEMTIHALDRKYRIEELPIEYRNRPANSVSKLNTIGDGIRVLRTLTMLFKDYRPMVFFGILSAISLLVGIGLCIPVFVEYWQTGLVPRFPTLIFSCFLITAALLLFITGVILSSISKSNRRLYELIRLSGAGIVGR